ncbi:MAG: septum formation family protein [Cellulomonas sp.]|uniref:Septum formation-related domain-containing protein n=1 Tax=Cellulomonas gelida TaxID=1712 RepID=A0A4Y3KN44_9CELL|nr:MULTISPECIES: septum formation family protein [Cellulomonas]KMM45686.1 hypothetical protein CWIS_09350 [Cellulomonas sp. A375-1]MCR6649658.1 septum formation family protein [Cellulomonas sp.]MCR6705633.1 septum formation family protein [Cellulomonas sp.]GEA85066.1 hypothetical protein CGE01nite_23170 [Cellulomonas gelida]GGL16351.1 hypothetical protein GCM10009774_03470 [Cellulomonas gelida]
MHVGRSTPRALVRATVGVLVVAVCAGCSFFDRGDDTEGRSVFDVKVGECFRAPKDITVELTELAQVPCTDPHEQEAYALVDYEDTAATAKASGAASFPGVEALTAFAQGACAQEFEDYVGVDYRDSRLWFTYLLPSARGWEQDADRTTLCFVTTTGEQLTRSVAGTGW